MKFLILLILLACNSVPVKSPSPESVPSSDEVMLADYLTVTGCSNCTEAQLKFIKEAVIKVNETVKSSCFESFMVERELIQTNENSRKEVVDSLKGVVIEAEMYYTLRRVLGYTLPSAQKIWINRRYMTSWNQCDLASLLGHESAHKVGYGHSFKHTPQRPFSVPYSINEAFDKCCTR